MSLAPVSVFEKSMSEPLTIDPQGAASLTQNWAGQAIETTGALLLVIAAVLGVSLLLRHLQRRAGGNSGQLQVLHALAVGSKDRVLLIQVGGDQILLGLGSNGLRHLHTLSEPVVAAAEGEVGNQNSFTDTLKAITGKTET